MTQRTAKKEKHACWCKKKRPAQAGKEKAFVSGKMWGKSGLKHPTPLLKKRVFKKAKKGEDAPRLGNIGRNRGPGGSGTQCGLNGSEERFGWPLGDERKTGSERRSKKKNP